MSVLYRPYFYDEAAAFTFVEGVIWPNGPVCHHCGCTGRITAVKANAEKRIRMGLYRCGDCKGQFTVRMGTIFEESKLPMTKWLQAIHLMCSSKKGVFAHQLHRTLETTYKTAWFLAHRIREAMRTGQLAAFGQGGGAVEADETYIGFDPDEPKQTRGYNHKIKVLTLLDRDTGAASSRVVEFVNSKIITEIVSGNLSKEARLMTDEAGIYTRVGKTLAQHGHTHHGKGE